MTKNQATARWVAANEKACAARLALAKILRVDASDRNEGELCIARIEAYRAGVAEGVAERCHLAMCAAHP